MRLNQRQGDASQRAILEFIDLPLVPETPGDAAPEAEAKPADAKVETATK